MKKQGVFFIHEFAEKGEMHFISLSGDLVRDENDRFPEYGVLDPKDGSYSGILELHDTRDQSRQKLPVKFYYDKDNYAALMALDLFMIKLRKKLGSDIDFQEAAFNVI